MIVALSIAYTPLGHRRRTISAGSRSRRWQSSLRDIITIIPVLAMLKAGRMGPSPLVALVQGPGRARQSAYFWITGGLSSFLDNAPTYLVFFERGWRSAAPD